LGAFDSVRARDLLTVRNGLIRHDGRRATRSRSGSCGVVLGAALRDDDRGYFGGCRCGGRLRDDGGLLFASFGRHFDGVCVARVEFVLVCRKRKRAARSSSSRGTRRQAELGLCRRLTPLHEEGTRESTIRFLRLTHFTSLHFHVFAILKVTSSTHNHMRPTRMHMPYLTGCCLDASCRLCMQEQGMQRTAATTSKMSIGSHVRRDSRTGLQ
jgi:hypothetical protein